MDYFIIQLKPRAKNKYRLKWGEIISKKDIIVVHGTRYQNKRSAKAYALKHADILKLYDGPLLIVQEYDVNDNVVFLREVIQ